MRERERERERERDQLLFALLDSRPPRDMAKCYSGVPVKPFLDEISIEVGRLSKTGCLPESAGPHLTS